MPLQPSERAELRRSDFKALVGTSDAGRVQRERAMVEIRKAGRGSALRKRRLAPAAAGVDAAPSAPMALDSMVREATSLPVLVQGLRSDDTQLWATREFRKLLSIENPPIQEVISTGVLPCFVQLLAREDNPELQFEATWALNNIILGTSENIKEVVSHNAVPMFVKLLSSPNEDIIEQALLALGNVAGSSPLFGEIVLAHGVLLPLQQLPNVHNKLSILRMVAWAVSNLCRCLPREFEQVKLALPILQQLIHSQDKEIISDSCWALSDLSSANNENMQAVVEYGICPRVVELLIHPSPSVILSALHVIGNIAGGDCTYIQCIIDHRALPYLLNILTNNQNKYITVCACRIISNIMAGNNDQIQAVINANIVSRLVRLMHTGEFDVKKYAAWAIFNATAGGTHDQIRYLVSQGCINAFCKLTAYMDTSLLVVCLNGLENILRIGEAKEEPSQICGVNMYAHMIDDADGLYKIEYLETHENNVISKTATRVLMYCRRER